jgi:bacteriocin-like protein
VLLYYYTIPIQKESYGRKDNDMKNFFDTFKNQEAASSKQPALQELNEDELKSVTGGMRHEHHLPHPFLRRELHHMPWRGWHAHRDWEHHR